MKCIFLNGNYMLSCLATREIYIPSLFEHVEYCTSGRYKLCSYYCKSDVVESCYIPEKNGIQAE